MYIRFCFSIVILAGSLAVATAQPADSKAAPTVIDSSVPSMTADQSIPAAESTSLDEAAPLNAEGEAAQLNLLGQTDTNSGQSKRNENVQFNPVDNNALKDLNQRMGATATILDSYDAERSYFGAEYGSSPRSTIHVAPTTGRSVHGRLYASHVNSIFNSRAFFQVGGVKPARDNQYGFELLVPLWRGASLSLDGSQTKTRGMVNGNVLIPLPEERIPLTTDPDERVFVEQIMNSYPNELPNRTDISARMLNTNSPQRIDGDRGGLRLDQSLGENDRVSLRYSFISHRVDAFQFVAGQNPDTWTRSHTARATWSRVISPSSVFDGSFGLDRVMSLLVPEENNLGPSLRAGRSLTPLGPSGQIPIDRAETKFRYAARLRQVRGNHNWVAGFDILRRRFNGLEALATLGSFRFTNDFDRDAITNLRMGTASSYRLGIGSYYLGYRNWELSFFLGDTWRANSNLTLSLGLRYEPRPSPYEVNNRAPVTYEGDFNNLAPQFGFAYDTRGGLGIIRGSYGIQYGAISPATFQLGRGNPPLSTSLVIQGPDLLDPLGNAAGDGEMIIPPSILYALDPNLATPYSQQYSFLWEPDLGGAWQLQLGYVGSRTLKLIQNLYQNRASIDSDLDLTTGTVPDRRPDQSISEVRFVSGSSRAYYDAAKVSMLLPNWHGLTVDASYWFSKALDLGANYADDATGRQQARAQFEFESHSDLKGLSNFDQPHAFLLRASYETPSLLGQSRWLRAMFGSWNFSTVVLLKTGTPFTVLSGSDSPGYGNVDGTIGDRPNILDPTILGRTIGHPDTSEQLLPKSAFSFIEPGEKGGNLGRATFRKGPIRNVNAALSRRFLLSSEKVISFQAESVNFFNTPQFMQPTLSLTEDSFGQITNTLNEGRTFRFRLSFDF